MVKRRTEIRIGNHIREETRTEATRFETGDRENWSIVLASRKIYHGERLGLGCGEKRLRKCSRN
jgi:hypothetical protein